MPRIDIELTSASPDGLWTWRAAGARQPRGVLDGSILPDGAAVGQQLRVEADYEVEGITVQSVVPSKEKAARTDLLELIPERSFDPVIQQRARPERDDRREPGERSGRRDRRRRPDGEPGRPRERPDRDPGRRREGRGRDEPGGDGARRERSDNDERRHRPHFTPPPELPQRPKPKRLRPGKRHRTEVLAALPDEQRPIAELALQGMAAVRQRLKEDNARLRAEGKPEMPTASVLKLAEDLLPRVRVAEWFDRAEAAQRQLDHLDLRDLRSVVAGADDPAVVRDESTRDLAASLKEALVTKQESEQQQWLADIDVALTVGRVVRALRLSSQPPKAGVPFPAPLAERLVTAATASLQPGDGPDRWAAVLEATAFSPVRTQVAPAGAPDPVPDELRATVTRLAPLLPQVAALFGIEAPAKGPAPRPLRPAPRRRGDAAPAARTGGGQRRTDRRDAPPRAAPDATASADVPPEPAAPVEAEPVVATEPTEPVEAEPVVATEPPESEPVVATESPEPAAPSEPADQDHDDG